MAVVVLDTDVISGLIKKNLKDLAERASSLRGFL